MNWLRLKKKIFSVFSMFELIIFIIVLSVLVLVHELGHYILARKNKITIQEFGLGYPPRLLKLFTYQGTIFSLNLIPFGGFVQMLGENGPEEVEAKEKSAKKSTTKQLSTAPFYNKSIRARLETLLAGVVFNFAFAILAFGTIFSITGIPVELANQARIYDFAANSPALLAGMKKDTNIVAFYSANDAQWVTVQGIKEVQDYVSNHLGEEVIVQATDTCELSTCPQIYEEYQVYLRSKEETPETEGAMGVTFSEIIYQHYPWYLAPIKGIVYGFKEALMMGLMIIQALGTLLLSLLRGQAVGDSVAGPIGIVHQAQVYGFFDGGILNILSFAALLSINLGIMNLLPLPALDGGRAIFVLLEKVLPKKKIEKVANWANYLGFLALIVLMIVVSIKDVMQILR